MGADTQKLFDASSIVRSAVFVAFMAAHANFLKPASQPPIPEIRPCKGILRTATRRQQMYVNFFTPSSFFFGFAKNLFDKVKNNQDRAEKFNKPASGFS